MMLPEENQPDQIRVSVSALLEYAARVIEQVPGVCGSIDEIVRFIKITSNNEHLPPSEKIDFQLTPLTLDVSLCLDALCNLGEVAREVQKRLFTSLKQELELPVHRVNIEISRVK
ncbi:MAG TPA: hypothetical protein VLH40_02885 [Atribacteraceae bacterium]|nr:hypothetical protein [Atribacteraceae bacterium]